MSDADPFPGPWRAHSWGTQDGRVIHRVEALSLDGKPLVVCYVETREQAEAICASKGHDTGLREVEAVLERMEKLRQHMSESQEAMRKRLHTDIANYAEALQSARERIKQLEQAQAFELTP